MQRGAFVSLFVAAWAWLAGGCSGSEQHAAPASQACRADLPTSGGVEVGARLSALLVPELSELAEADAAMACADSARLLLITVQAGFCGSCQLFAERFVSALPAPLSPRLSRIDLLASDELNAPVEQPALARWAERAGPGVSVGVASEALLSALGGQVGLPVALLLDARNLEVLSVTAQAWPTDVAREVATRLAGFDGIAAAAFPDDELRDGRFSGDAWSLIQRMSLRQLVKAPDLTNRWADDARAVRLGKSLFFDPRFSSNGAVSCGSCHQRERTLANPDATPPQGVGPSHRNTPTLAFSAFSRFQFWDGRADALWGQATKPVEDAVEMGSSRVELLHRLADGYRGDFEAIFGALPDEAALAKFPAKGRPGTPEWELMSIEQRDSATRALVNYGKAIAAFERSLVTLPLALDAYIDGRSDAMTEPQKDGLAAFVRAGCPQCHSGPLLSDGAFHVLRLATGRDDLRPDLGRLDGLTPLLTEPMRAAGPYSDAPEAAAPLATRIFAGLRGAFKTPALRGVATTAPYGHGGGDSTLAGIVERHRTAGLPADSTLTTGLADRWLMSFSERERDSIVTFLKSLPVALAPY
ncbi:MAG: cytochrome c peroxidase [Polyangiaceae bacterium]